MTDATSSKIPDGYIRVRFTNSGVVHYRWLPPDHVLFLKHREAREAISRLPEPSLNRPSLASQLPSEILTCILEQTPSAIARQDARLAHSLVSRHWYTATKHPTAYAVTNTSQAARLAAKLRAALDSGEDSESPVRRLSISLALLGGVHESDEEAFRALIDACPVLDTLEVSFGQEWDDHAREHPQGPGCDDTFGKLDAAIRKQTQLRVLRIIKHNWILPCLDLFQLIRPLQNLQVLDVSDCEIEDTNWEKCEKAPSIAAPPLELPLRTLMLQQLPDPPTNAAVAQLAPFARETLRRVRLGKVRCDPSSPRDALSPLLTSLTSVAPQILDFDCRMYPWHKLFNSKSFLDLNTLLVQMTALESLEMTLSTRETLTELDQTHVVDRAILHTLKSLKHLRHLTLHIRGEPPARELLALVHETNLKSLTLAMGRPDPKFSSVKEDPAWITDVPAKLEALVPATTQFRSHIYQLD
ncbi:hypothetical protein RQP46_003052 [Phenoliferia psychrophenolica]